MLIMETGQAAGSILVPYAIKAIMDGVAHSTGATVLENLTRAVVAIGGFECGRNPV